MTPNKSVTPRKIVSKVRMNNYGPGPQIANVNDGGNVTINYVFNGIPYQQSRAEVECMLEEMYGIRPINASNASISHSADWANLSRVEFCLFVLDNAVYDSGTFSIAKTRALIHTHNREKYRHLSPSVIDEILLMPCIFAKRNEYYKLSNPNAEALLGKVIDIIRQEATITFRFDVYAHFPQQVINDNIKFFGLLGNDLKTQLDEEHWSIRTGDLLKVVQELGITIL